MPNVPPSAQITRRTGYGNANSTATTAGHRASGPAAPAGRVDTPGNASLGAPGAHHWYRGRRPGDEQEQPQAEPPAAHRQRHESHHAERIEGEHGDRPGRRDHQRTIRRDTGTDATRCSPIPRPPPRSPGTPQATARRPGRRPRRSRASRRSPDSPGRAIADPAAATAAPAGGPPGRIPDGSRP